MQLNMSFFINFFKRLFSNESEEKVQEVTPVAVKRTLPPTPINPMTDEVENSNTVTHDLINEIEKNKHVQEEQKSPAIPTIKPAAKVEPVVIEEIKVEAKVEAEVKTEPKAEVAPKAKPEVKAEVKAEVKTAAKVKVTPKAKPAVKAEVKTEPKAKIAPKAKPAAKAKVKPATKTNAVPKVIVLDESETKLNIKAKRIVGHCKKNTEAFIVTHIVKPDQEKLRLNLALTGWDKMEGLSFVTYDTANDAIVFSKKCDDTVSAQLNGVLLAWAREVHKKYY